MNEFDQCGYCRKGAIVTLETGRTVCNYCWRFFCTKCRHLLLLDQETTPDGTAHKECPGA